jgi:hypothetical protein
MDQIIVITVAIASCLPTGIHDPKALTRYHEESVELRAKIDQGDSLGAVLEVVDVAYYAIKAMIAGLMTYDQAWDGIAHACVTGGVLPGVLAHIMIAKYDNRMKGAGKDDELEREQVRALLHEKGIILV